MLQVGATEEKEEDIKGIENQISTTEGILVLLILYCTSLTSSSIHVN
jgi:hypothetical protein